MKRAMQILVHGYYTDSRRGGPLEEIPTTGEELEGYYSRARELWEEIINNSERPMSEMVSIKQSTFERDCGGRYIGQEIMAYVGIAMFYTSSIGFGDDRGRAREVYRAILDSICSLEVKYYAKQAADAYGLEDDD